MRRQPKGYPGRINEIKMHHMLPEVFATEKIPESQVWLKDVKFDRGCRVMVEAASGTGKSSMCAYLYGSRADYSGDLLFNDTDARSISIDAWQKIRRENIAYLPQELSLFPELTAMENIMLKNNLTNHVGQQTISDWLGMLGIDSRKHYPVGKMSIGQQQRVAILRTLCQPFDFLILDEPVSHLDETNNKIVAELVEHEALRQEAGVIVTSVGNRLLLEKTIELRL